MIVQPYPRPLRRLSETSNSSGVQVALATRRKRTLIQATQWVNCRDFLTDCYHVFHTGQEQEIHGFFVSKEDVADTMNMKILTRCVNKPSVAKKLAAFWIKVGRAMSVKPPRVYETRVNDKGEPTECLLVLFSKDPWTLSPQMVSWATLGCRLGVDHMPGDGWQDTVFTKGNKYDRGFVEWAPLEKWVEFVEGGGWRNYLRWPTELNTYQIHHGSGIVATLSGRNTP